MVVTFSLFRWIEREISVSLPSGGREKRQAGRCLGASDNLMELHAPSAAITGLQLSIDRGVRSINEAHWLMVMT